MSDSPEDLRREMRRTTADFLRGEAGPQARRTAMESVDGYDRALFARGFVELGLGAILVPERLGGLGLGFTEAAVVIGELGRRLVPSPLPDTLVAASVLAEVADATEGRASVESVLTRLSEGPFSIAVAGLTTAPNEPSVTATRTDDGWRLDGRAAAVPHGATADLLLVLTGEGEEAAVQMLWPDQNGVRRSARRSLDHTRRLADLELTEVYADRVSADGDRGALAARLRCLALVANAVESSAAAESCLDETVAYLKVRQQFGRPIGAFQALKHRCADLAVAIHGAVATATYAVSVAANRASILAGQASGSHASGDELGVVARLAKSVCADTLMRVAAECLQLHGGIGFTFEHDSHLYLKRGKANQLLLGSGPTLRRELGQRMGL